MRERGERKVGREDGRGIKRGTFCVLRASLSLEISSSFVNKTEEAFSLGSHDQKTIKMVVMTTNNNKNRNKNNETDIEQEKNEKQ